MLIRYVFLLSWAYWLYLGLFASMVIVHDAIAFEGLAKGIYQQGWVQYFVNGPNREPLFPALIAMSMAVADWLQLPYQQVQMIVQLFILGLSQWLLWRLLSRLGVGVWVTAAVLLYFAFSPALVNSALSLFSEILTYPLVLSVILLTLAIFRGIRRWYLPSLGLALLGVALVLVKGVFEVVFLVYLIGALLMVIGVGRDKRWVVLKSLGIALFIFLTAVHGYKMINAAYNGNYTITDRSGFMVYGSAVRRTAPLGEHQVKAALASVAGDGVCLRFFSKDECWYWNFQTTDGFGMARAAELGYLPGGEINKTMIKEAGGLFLSNPCAYVFFGVLEMLKMFFWESTKIGFVNYPAAIKTIYELPLFNEALRLIISSLSLMAVLLVTFYQGFWRHCSKEGALALRLVLLMIWPFVLSYSFVSVLTRYSFAVVPFYLICIALCLQYVMNRKLDKAC